MLVDGPIFPEMPQRMQGIKMNTEFFDHLENNMKISRKDNTNGRLNKKLWPFDNVLRKSFILGQNYFYRKENQILRYEF